MNQLFGGIYPALEVVDKSKETSLERRSQKGVIALRDGRHFFIFDDVLPR